LPSKLHSKQSTPHRPFWHIQTSHAESSGR
jgi:hypothetical protein